MLVTLHSASAIMPNTTNTRGPCRVWFKVKPLLYTRPALVILHCPTFNVTGEAGEFLSSWKINRGGSSNFQINYTCCAGAMGREPLIRASSSHGQLCSVPA